MPAEDAVVTWLVTLDGTRSIDVVAEDLRRAGLNDLQLLRAIGCIVGRAAEDFPIRLGRVAGVGEIARDPQIDIGPPDADTTW